MSSEACSSQCRRCRGCSDSSAEYRRLKTPLPVLSGLWFLLVLIGMFGTVAFGLQGFFEGVFNVDNQNSLSAFWAPTPRQVLRWLLAGPTFPSALLVLSAMEWHTQLSPRVCAVLV